MTQAFRHLVRGCDCFVVAIRGHPGKYAVDRGVFTELNPAGDLAYFRTDDGLVWQVGASRIFTDEGEANQVCETENATLQVGRLYVVAEAATA